MAAHLLSLLLLAGASSADTPVAWVTDGLRKVFPETRAPLVACEPVVACRGETVGLQVVLRTGSQAVDRARVEPFALTLDDGAGIRIRDEQIFRQHAVPVTVPSGNAVREPREWPDALIPQRYVRDSGIPAHRTVAWWLDVVVPEDVPAGEYQGTCRVTVDSEELPLPVTVRVADVVLPLQRHVRANVAVYHRDILLGYANRWWAGDGEPWTVETPAYQAIVRQIYELLLQHRLCAYDLPVELTSPEADDYYADPRVHSIRVPWVDGPESRRLVDGVARARSRGAFEKLYYYAADEPGPGAYAGVREVAAAVRKLAPGVPFVATVAPVDGLAGAVDIWCPNLGNYLGLGYLDPAALAERLRRDEQLWWYTCCVPTGPYPTWLVDDDAVAPRATMWLMARYGWTGFVYSMAHGWSDDPYASVASFNDTNGDGLLLYPGQRYGTAEAFPSLRLKLLRAGLQDYELLRLLAVELAAAGQRRGVPVDGWRRVRELTGRLVTAPYRVEREPAALRTARRETIAELLAARRDDLVTWREGDSLVGLVRPGTPLAVDGRPTAPDESGRWRAPAGEAAWIEIGDPPLRLHRDFAAAEDVVAPPPWSVVAAQADRAPVIDGLADDRVWETAPAVVLPNGVVFRFAHDADSLYVVATGAEQATVVLDPGRRHGAAYTFTATQAPKRALRRTAVGRDAGYAPEWQAVGQGGVVELRIPFQAVGGPPRTGDAWGMTCIGYTTADRAFWFDHHGDLRVLPTLRF